MNWKFWQKEKNATGPMDGNARLPKPKELPGHIGLYLVTKEKLDPDWVWALKCVKRPRKENKSLYDFRIFSETDAANAGIKVVNYETLEDHGGLVLYHGYSDKRGGTFHIESVSRGQAA